MANLLKGATAWLAKTVRQAAPTPIRYVVGSDSVVIPDAVKGASDFEATSDDGYVQNTRSIDWLVAPSSIVIGGEQIKPKKSHKIFELDPDTLEVVGSYAITGAPGLPEAEIGGQFADLTRIHTTRIG